MDLFDFNNAQENNNFEVIPKGTISKVVLKIKPGGYNDETQGLTGGYATRSEISDAVYLACEFTVIDGIYTRRRVWSNIGLYSEKNNNCWGNMGRSLIRSILNSAKGFISNDKTDAAQEARKIKSLADLDGLVFLAKIDVELDENGSSRNVIKRAIGPEHKDYDAFMGNVATAKPEWA